MELLLVILALGLILFITFRFSPRSRRAGRSRALSWMPRKKALGPVERHRASQKWDEIEGMVKLGRPSTLKTAVIEADKLLAQVLVWMSYKGNMAERLGAARTEFSDYDGVWYAHRIRNRMVHDLDHEQISVESRTAIEKFRQAFRDLGVI